MADGVVVTDAHREFASIGVQSLFRQFGLDAQEHAALFRRLVEVKAADNAYMLMQAQSLHLGDQEKRFLTALAELLESALSYGSVHDIARAARAALVDINNFLEQKGGPKCTKDSTS